MPFPIPTHPGHTFLGYRGVSKRHFVVKENNAIRYTPPPANIVGATQLGSGVYVASHLRDARDYALDSAWNYYCSMFRSREVNGPGREAFEQLEWRNWGRVHAVFMPTAKYESDKASIADFSHVNIDRMGDFVRSNVMHHVARNRSRTSGVKSQLEPHMQTVIYPPHTDSLFVKDITDQMVEYFARGGD